MDYEKEYKSLVAKVKKAHRFAQTDSTKSVLEDILPELKESEDEEIRKELVAVLEDLILPDDQRRRFLNYLEKQKEQKPIRDIISGDAIESCMLRYLQSAANRNDDIEIIEDTKKYKKELLEIIEKEQKPELVQQPPITYTYPSDASRDERLKAALIALLNSDLIKVAGNKFTKQDLIEWVERIPTDKRDCKDCAMFLNGKCTKPHWKPSEEQMDALNALNCHGDLSYVGQQNQLISLYNDLKKLI